MAVLFFVLAALACTAHCKPSGDSGAILKKSSEASATAGDHETKLSQPWIREMEGFEEEINKAIEAVLPLLNILFGFDSSDEIDEDNSCDNEMIVQLVPEDSDDASSTKDEPVPVPVDVPRTTAETPEKNEKEDNTVHETK